MRRFHHFASVFLLPVSLLASATDQWPMYLGDVRHNSNNPGQTQLNPLNAAHLKQVWKINVGAVISTGITVSNGYLFFGDWSGNFYSVEAATGKIAWTTYVGKSPDPPDNTCQPGTGVTGQSVIAGGTVYVPGGDSAVYALDRATGQVQWRTVVADPTTGSQLWSSMMLSNNALYVGIASLGDCPLVRGGLARIDLAHPDQPLLRYLVPDGADGAGVWSTPAIDEQASRVYVSTGNADYQDASGGYYGSAIVALDAATLEVKASFFMPLDSGEADADFGSSPGLFETPDGAQYVAANGKDGVMYVLRRPDLALAWTYKLATGCVSPEQGCGSISTPAFDGHMVVVGAGQTDAAYDAPGAVFALDPVTRNPIWVYNAPGMVLAPVTLTPGLVFAPTSNGLTVLSATTGAELWNDGKTEGLYGQAPVVRGVVYAAYFTGDVIAWGVPASGSAPAFAAPERLVFRYTLGGPAPTPQAVAVYAATGTLTFTLTSDSRWLSASPGGGPAPATATVTADITGLQPGSYSGKLTLTAAGSTVTVPVDLLIAGALQALSPAGIVNAASFASGALSPGALFSIFGAGLAADTGQAAAVPWPTLLNGISVQFNGIPAPLIYVSPTQINGQVPFEIPPGPATVTMASNGTQATGATVNIASAAPGIFVSNSRAAALNQDGSLNTPENPAPAGSVISVYFTGQGALDNLVISGAAAPYEYLCNALTPISATIGDQPALVQYAGLAPRFVGLAQINIIVPALVSGEYPVILLTGDAKSNTATVSVRSTP